ncbi:hypothetical protein MML48_2g00005750 [Holotrichia oblita]|uniref:Uncharacterized protein n=1 Tax=Holotrichia oblita TaxID=644536 RepID=A0ACB9TNH1_HOLOL|nr:hypothetical protein MML48_2g00005750 [Holotrichia oblita]
MSVTVNATKVKDPPLLGFDFSEVELSEKENARISSILKELRSVFSVSTTAPYFRTKSDLIMDIFSKYHNVTVQIDNDSGYISQNQESNSESILDNFPESIQIMSDVKSVYLNEDALLEKPELGSHYDTLASAESNEEIGPSVSTESESFSILRDSNISEISNESSVSIVIPKIEPLIVTEKHLNADTICDISTNFNIENNINIINLSNISKTESNQSNFNVSKDFDSDRANSSFNDYTYDHSNNLSNGSHPLSPELFSDEEIIKEKHVDICNKNIVQQEKYVLTEDHKLIKNVRSTLSGVLPPPSFTSIYLTADEISKRIEENRHLFWTEHPKLQNITERESHKTNSSDKQWKKNKRTLLLTTTDKKCLEKCWPDIMEERYHGLQRFQLLSRKRSPFKVSPRKSPKKSPRKSPRKKLRTPSSSAKKRLSQQLQSISHQNANSSRASATKRALFQSPDKTLGTSGTSSLSPFKKRMTPKCALFTSPSRSSISKTDNKRKRTDSDDFNPSKLFRSVSLQESVLNTVSAKREMPKVKSEMNISTSHHTGELSAHHKKKLQWAVYEALRGQNIGINHPQFKQFASVLARVTKKFLPNLAANAPRPEGGTSDRMLRIARQHIHTVLKGKSVDEIVQEFEANRLKNLKPTGYVGLEPIHVDISFAKNKENVFRDRLNTISNEKNKTSLNRDELIKTTLTKIENRVDRVRRTIKFDDENNSDIR